MRPDLSWTVFEDDPALKRKVWLGWCNKEKRFVAAHVEQHVDEILEDNMEAEKASHGKRLPDYNRIASVPLTMWEKTGLGDAIDAGDRKYLSKLLNDSDYRKFRTSRGKV